jgi:hypothetical protein
VKTNILKNQFLKFYILSRKFVPASFNKNWRANKNTMPASFTLQMSDWRAKNNNKNFCPPV